MNPARVQKDAKMNSARVIKNAILSLPETEQLHWKKLYNECQILRGGANGSFESAKAFNPKLLYMDNQTNQVWPAKYYQNNMWEYLLQQHKDTFNRFYTGRLGKSKHMRDAIKAAKDLILHQMRPVLQQQETSVRQNLNGWYDKNPVQYSGKDRSGFDVKCKLKPEKYTVEYEIELPEPRITRRIHLNSATMIRENGSTATLMKNLDYKVKQDFHYKK